MINEFKIISNINEYVTRLLSDGEYKAAKYIKTAEIRARRGKPGEKISTVMADGLHETDNVVTLDEKTGKPGWVVTNSSSERYIVSDSVFSEKYEAVEGSKDAFRPVGKPVVALQIKENISFLVPWGERFNLVSGGYLVISDMDNIYGIQQKEFNQTYKLCGI